MTRDLAFIVASGLTGALLGTAALRMLGIM